MSGGDYTAHSAASWTVNVDPLRDVIASGQAAAGLGVLDMAAPAASIFQPPRPNGVDMRSPIKEGGCNGYQHRAGPVGSVPLSRRP